METKETIALKNAIDARETLKRRYGCPEVTIGFYNNGHGNERADYISMDAKGIIYAYEIKVSKADLQSKAKKSFYGHYNYLIVSDDLAEAIKDWTPYLNDRTGVIAGINLRSLRKAQKIQLSPQTDLIVKESLVRSLWWRLRDASDAENIKLHKKLTSENKALKKETIDLRARIFDSEALIKQYERAQRIITGDEDFSFIHAVDRKREEAIEFLKLSSAKQKRYREAESK